MVTYDNSSKRLSELKGQIAAVKEQIKSINDNDAELKKQVEDYRQSISHLEKMQRQGDAVTRSIAKEQGNLKKAASNMDAFNQENHEQRRAYDRAEKLRETQKTLETLQEELNACEDLETVKARSKDITGKIAQVKAEQTEALLPVESLRNRRRDLKTQKNNVDSQVMRMTNEEQQRQERVKKVDGNTYHAMMWIKENAARFRRTVYGPILNEVSFNSPQHAQWLENMLSRNLLLTFIAQCPEDYDALQQANRDGTIKCNVAMMDQTNCATLSPARQKELNLSGLLIDLVKCEDTVRRALLNFGRMTTVGYAPDGWEMPYDPDSVQDVADQETGLIVMTPTVQHRIMLSRWVNSVTGKRELSAQISRLRPTRILDNAGMVNMDQLRELTKQSQLLASEMQNVDKELDKFVKTKRAYDDKIQLLSNEQNKLMETRKEIIRKTNQSHKLESDIEGMKRELDRGVESQKQAQIEKMKQALAALSVVAAKKQKALHVLLKFSICREAITRVRDAQRQHYDQLAAELSERSSRLEQLVKEKNALEASRNELRGELKNMRSFIYTQSGLFHCKNNPDPNDFSCKCSGGRCEPERTTLLQEVFDQKYSTNLNECTAILGVTADKIREIRVNERSIAEFEERERKIASLEMECAELKKQQEELSTDIKAKEDMFMETLKRLVGKLDTNFSLFMRNIKCKGRVELTNPDNFTQIGLDIKVSFRDNQEVQSLNGQVQSGGEKSLSTILFLLSLQDMVSFPFRFIDEINQNMDKRNERYVMTQLLYKGKNRQSAPQTFIITPKLLSDFPYDENVTFHIIFQGQYLPQGFNWNVIASSLPQRVSEKRALEGGEEKRQEEEEKRQKEDGDEEVEVLE
ncbi:hypothetical protein WA577_003620 [Blastocystis sp. JDR]